MMLNSKVAGQVVALAAVAVGCIALGLALHKPIMNVVIGLVIGGAVGGGLLLVLRLLQGQGAAPKSEEDGL